MENNKSLQGFMAGYKVSPRAVISDHQQNNLYVCDLIKHHGSYRSWNKEALDAALTDEDKHHVRKIYLSQKQEEEKIVWNYTSHGHYSVKTGYILARQITNLQHQPIQVPLGNIEMKIKCGNYRSPDSPFRG